MSAVPLVLPSDLPFHYGTNGQTDKRPNVFHDRLLLTARQPDLHSRSPKPSFAKKNIVPPPCPGLSHVPVSFCHGWRQRDSGRSFAGRHGPTEGRRHLRSRSALWRHTFGQGSERLRLRWSLDPPDLLVGRRASSERWSASRSDHPRRSVCSGSNSSRAAIRRYDFLLGPGTVLCSVLATPRLVLGGPGLCNVCLEAEGVG